MPRFRKKPVVISAGQWWSTYHGYGDPVQRLKGDFTSEDRCAVCHECLLDHGWIGTLEGGHRVCNGDWIIIGVHGERYPCKPDIFAETYEEVLDE